jgi:hypothetical protein
MCVQRDVAEKYSANVSANPLRLSLGHAGGRVSCHDDTDLALTSVDVGKGTGVFRDLTLTHLIPSRRLDEAYLLQLIENTASALVVLKSIRGLKIEDPPKGMDRMIKALQYWRGTPLERRALDAYKRGEKAGRAITAARKTAPINQGSNTNATGDRREIATALR